MTKNAKKNEYVEETRTPVAAAGTADVEDEQDARLDVAPERIEAAVAAVVHPDGQAEH